LGRLAVIVHATAGLLDAGFDGRVTLELSNLGVAPVALTPGMRIAQLTFTELTSPAERPYGSDRGSKYQGQTGPQVSRLSDDPEFGPDET
jgi:dCTP deaminase